MEYVRHIMRRLVLWKTITIDHDHDFNHYHSFSLANHITVVGSKICVYSANNWSQIEEPSRNFLYGPY